MSRDISKGETVGNLLYQRGNRFNVQWEFISPLVSLYKEFPCKQTSGLKTVCLFRGNVSTLTDTSSLNAGQMMSFLSVLQFTVKFIRKVHS